MITTLLLATALTGGGADSQDLTIAGLAPENSFFVIELNDVQGMIDRFAETGVGKLVLDGKSVSEVMEPMMEERAEELGIEPDQVTLPVDLGLVAYTVLDEELGVEMPAWLAYLAWKDSDAQVKALFENEIERMELKYEEDQLRGRDMYIFETELEMPNLDEFAGEVMPMMPMMGDSSHMEDALKKVFVVRDGSMIVMCSEPGGIDQAFKIIDGGSAKTLSEAAAYQALEDMIPGTPGAQAALLTESLSAIAKPVLGPGYTAALPVIQAAFGDITGWGFWGSVAPEGNLATWGQNITFNGEPRGVMKLFDVATPLGPIPSFVSDESLSYGRFNFDFKSLIPTVNEIIAALPEAQGQQVQPMVQMWGPMLQTSLETLGPEVHSFSSESDDEFNPMRTTLAIPTTDTKKVDQLISMFGSMAGLQPRDFNGDTIYTDPMDDLGTLAIGIGAGSLLVGQVDGVEAVLRSAGQSDLPSLGRTKIADRVEQAMPSGDLLTWGFWNTSKMMEMTGSMSDMMPAGAQRMDADDQLEEMLDNVDMKELAKLVGPQWVVGRSTKNGMQFQFGWLRNDG